MKRFNKAEKEIMGSLFFSQLDRWEFKKNMMCITFLARDLLKSQHLLLK